MALLLWIILTVIIAYIVKNLLQGETEKLDGVYSQPGRWYGIKKTVFILIYLVRQLRNKRTAHLDSRDIDERTIGYGQRSKNTIEEMECVQKLVPGKDAMDSIYFNGFNEDGTGLVLRMARRHENKMEVWFLIHLPGIGSLQLPIHPDTMTTTSDDTKYSALGLTIEPVEAMRTWKITFNGMCRLGLKTDWKEDTSNEDLLHVKFSLLWKSYTSHFDFDTELHPFLLADGVAREKWSSDFFEKLKKTHQTHYEQWGQISGAIYVEGHEERQLLLRGMRDHTYGIRGWDSFHRYAVQMGFLEDGSTFHVGVVSLPNTTSFLPIGYIYRPNGIKVKVSSLDMQLSELGENGTPPTEYTISFVADGEKYYQRCEVNTTEMLYCGTNWGGVVHERLCTFTLNGIKGWGVSEFEYRHTGGCPLVRTLPAPIFSEPAILSSEDKKQLVVTFSSRLCQSSELVGGKGSQLAVLSELQSQSKEFIVPGGVCVTTAAYQLQEEMCPDWQGLLDELRETCHAVRSGDIEKTCNKVVEQIQKSEMVDSIKQSISTTLRDIFQEKTEETLFAVRSSAIGEDTSDASAAGQMITLLAVQGVSKVYEAVCQCWASQYSYQAVQYRRQHGQSVNSTMGVVIQEMVSSQISGVLFSWHPITGHPKQMVINSNYGLGESVVSGSTEPDTVTLSCSQNGNFEIISKDIGSKQEQLQVQENGGTVTSTVADTDASKCSIPDEFIYKLAAIAKLIEKHYGNPRDMEWAIKDGCVYVLQARPITTLEMETEESLMTEFDSPLAMDHEWVTTANIGEMMPGAITPLTESVFSRSIEKSMQGLQQRFGVLPEYWPVYKTTLIRHAHCFINMHMLGNFSRDRVSLCSKEMADLSLFGRIVHEMTNSMLNKYNGTLSWWRTHVNSLKFIKSQIDARNKLDELKKMAESYHFDKVNDRSTANDLYNEINQKLPDYDKAFDDSVTASTLSGMWSQVVVAIIASSTRTWNTENFSDVALLLSDCQDVASADVPVAMERVTKEISKSGNTDTFLSMNAETAAEWLKSGKSGEAGKQFQTFLQDHGHRCVRESELREPSWGLDPTLVIPIIQAMLRNPYGTEKKTVSVEDAINQLKSPVSFVGKHVLKWVVPKARVAVGNRELGKSLAIKIVDHFKCAYWKLSELMVKEGLLPDKDLLFFLTHQELGQVIRRSNTTLVGKAIRRRRVLSSLSKMQFPEISIGLPQPLNMEDDKISTSSVKMTGMPVCHGVVKGVARVVRKLQDAHNIQSGDVLIVCYTDVGWSPYFPLIGGLVTELGGLLSHGAVVAREYGLPCVVNIKHATSVFQSGDYVLLNGTKGTIEKIEQ
ncbi:rifampicin phosphotransferase-like isoform X2 [Ptychodera flava]|uniref:rifampicin phosphotransferase-like isoform X2 n=1 Tax=Ptychodera flava TaxID=63121 RepID=UPI00396A4E3A